MEERQDLISRQQAIDAVNEWLRLYVINRTMSNVTSIQDILRQLPSAQPERKKGKWIDVDVMGMPAQACDQCNTFFPLAYTGGGHHYCPNCGAKMEE